MVFHLGFELPQPPATLLDSDSAELTACELEIIKNQIRKNSLVIESYIERIDLFVNAEKVPLQENFIQNLRERMSLLMEESDTFRRLLWRHTQGEQVRTPQTV